MISYDSKKEAMERVETLKERAEAFGVDDDSYEKFDEYFSWGKW